MTTLTKPPQREPPISSRSDRIPVRRDIGAGEGDQHAEGLEHDVIERRLLLALFGGGLGLEKGADARRAQAGAEGSRYTVSSWSNLLAPFSCAGRATFCFV
jgi:hypothetical protein